MFYSIHLHADVEHLIAKRIVVAKNQKAEKLAKDQHENISNTKFTKQCESCKLCTNKLGHQFDTRSAGKCSICTKFWHTN